MAKLFEIPLSENTSLDITPFIVLNTYAVSTQAVYAEWTDGNCYERRGIKRRKLEGSFSVKFFSAKDYQDFLSAIENNRVPGFDYIIANVYDNKKREVKEGAAVYLDYEPPNVEPAIGFSFNEEIEITVTER